MRKIMLSLLIVFFAGLSSIQAQNVMTPETIWGLARVGGEVVSPDGQYVVYGISHFNVDENSSTRDLFIIDRNNNNATSQLTDLAGSEYGVSFSANGKRVVFLNKAQVYTINPDGSHLQKVEADGESISNFKISPDGTKVLFTREVKTQKNLSDYYPNYKDAEVKIIDDLMYRHWDTWSDAYSSHVFVADFDGSKITNIKDIMADEAYDVPVMPFHGAEDLTWSPDSKSLIYVCKKVTGVEYATTTNTDLYLYDLEKGITTNITEGMMGYDTNPAYSPNGKYLAWNSMARNGYESDKNDIIVKDLKTGEKYNITAHWDETTTGFSWALDSKTIFFQATKEATNQIFTATLPKKLEKDPKAEIKQLTKGIFNVNTAAQADKKTLIASRQDMNHATELYSIQIKDGSMEKITDANDAVYDNLKLSKVEKRWVETTDGQKMLTWVILPPDFDPNKKYPTLLYCQGGPQSPVSQFYSFRWNFQLMAAQGYVVVAPNRRGLPGFGTKWNEDISKDWGGQSMRDYLAAIDEVAKEPWVDNDRLGAVGASYGGYSVYYLAGIHEGRFKSFISHCGLFNLESWYGVTEELFFANWDIGGPYWGEERAASYDKFSPHLNVDKWDTPIMVIHGGHDYRVPENQGLEAFQAAKLKGLNTRLLYFPNEGHWVLQPQNSIIWHKEFFRWLDETLK